MSVAIAKSKGAARPTLSPEKGNELTGLLLLFFGLFLAISLASYYPEDPSVFRHLEEEVRARNWAGAAGAHVAALSFGFLGLTCLLVPLFLLAASWRRLRRRGAVRVVGRGFGAALLLTALPPLLQLNLVKISWRGGGVEAGGAFGILIAEALSDRLNFIGALLVLLAAVACGSALVVQSTLGDVLASWRDRMRRLWLEYNLARERQKERRAKERARRRVITKHLQRVVEEKQRQGVAVTPPNGRRNTAAPATPAAPSAQAMVPATPAAPVSAARVVRPARDR